MKKKMDKIYRFIGKIAIRAAAQTTKEVSIDDFYQPPIPNRLLDIDKPVIK